MTMKIIRQINSPPTLTQSTFEFSRHSLLAITGWGRQEIGSLGRWAKISISSSWLSTQLTSDTSMQDWQEGWNILASFLVFFHFWFISDECTSRFKASYGCWGWPCDSATASNHHNFTCQLPKSLYSKRLFRRLWSSIFNQISSWIAGQNRTRAFRVHR